MMGWFSELFGEPLGAIGGMSAQQAVLAQQNVPLSGDTIFARMAEQAGAFMEWERRVASFGTDELREAHDRMATAAKGLADYE